VPCGKMQLPSAAERIAALAEFIRSFAAATELLLVGSSREAVDDLVQGLAHTSGATFGLHRFSFTRLAARLASRRLGGGGSHAQLRSRCGSIGSAGRLRSGGAKQATETTPPEGNLDDEVVFFPSSQSPVPIEISVTAANGGSLVLNLEQICI